MNIEQVKTNQNESEYKCWPLIRNEYRKSALNAYKLGDCDQAILCDSKVLSCGFVGTQLNADPVGSDIDDQAIGSTIHQQQESGNSLIDYLSECLNEVTINEPKSKHTKVIADVQTEAKDLYDKCAKLPPEWNVLQLNQSYDGYNGYSTKKDMYTSDGLVTLTLYRYNLAVKRNNRAFGLVLELNELNPNGIFSMAHEINQVLYKNYMSAMSSVGYSDFIKNLTQKQSKLVADMKLWLGPWVTLFSGKIKGKHGEEFEKQIFDEVAKVCQEFDDFPDDKLVLLSLAARRVDLLDSDKIKQAARDIGRNQKECSRIAEFLAQLKSKTTFKEFKYYPCILVIDEIVDQMPWEMVLPSQEFTRAHSIYMLLDLYDRYKDRIEDGYLKMSLKNGFAVINPDNDEKLGDMAKRMSKYYDECLPKWGRIERVVPTLEQLTDAMKKNDLFVYSGHGSSLQFFTDADIENIKHNCLLLLFGCESIAMKPRGTVCEATSSSYTYFRTGCPGTLGAITIVTDVWIDLITILVLTQWITSEEVKHPTIDVCKDEHTKERVRKILRKFDGKRNPSLLELLCDIRNEQDISIRIRSALVYRGLPPYNSAFGK